jgi:anaerobic magnesium-protoporphyrin IX monomethyl ester cyclase
MSLVTLVRPPTVVPKWAHTTPICPPIGVAYVASAVREAGHRVAIVDALGEGILETRAVEGRPGFLTRGLSIEELVQRVDQGTTCVGLSCMFSHEWPMTRSVINELRKALPHAVIVAGGEHVTALPEFSLTDCQALDCCVLGEGEETIVDLVASLDMGRPIAEVPGLVYRENGDTIRTATRGRIRQLNDIAPPAWDLVPLANYLDSGLGFGVNRGRCLPVLASRGCPYECTFCSNPTMWTTRWIARDPDILLNEMLGYIEQYHIENFDFYDLTAIVRRDWIIDFCQKLIERGHRFTWQLPSGTRSEAIDGKVARLLYDSGCRNVSYAPESGSPSVLKRIKKKVALDRMKSSMRAAIKSGLNVKANIIIGFPGETHGEIFETLRFLVEMALIGVHDMSISPFSPYPGSELFDDLRKNGKISELSDDYFYSLETYTDLLHTISMSEHVGGRALGLYRSFGMLLFYGVAFAARPWRIVKTIVNVFSDRQESRGEMSLRDLFFRIRGSETMPPPPR